MPPQHVRRNKTDRADAAALLEADRYGAILPVPVKMATRTDRLNTTRGLLREFGLDLPQGPAAVLTQVPTWLADAESPIPPTLRTALTELIAGICTLDTRIADFTLLSGQLLIENQTEIFLIFIDHFQLRSEQKSTG